MEPAVGTNLLTMFVPPGAAGLRWARGVLTEELLVPGASSTKLNTLRTVLGSLPTSIPLAGLLIHAGVDSGHHHFSMSHHRYTDDVSWSLALMDKQFHLLDRVGAPFQMPPAAP